MNMDGYRIGVFVVVRIRCMFAGAGGSERGATEGGKRTATLLQRAGGLPTTSLASAMVPPHLLTSLPPPLYYTRLLHTF